ncbi:MAG: hypothetical protein ABWY57_15270 [Mycetocola sp.]
MSDLTQLVADVEPEERRVVPGGRGDSGKTKSADSAARKSKSTDPIEIGGVPKVDLLPPEVRAQAAVRVVRRRAVLAILAAIVLLGLAGAYAGFANFTSALQLANAQQNTNILLAEQLKYGEIRKVQSNITAVQDAQRVGAWTEVDWENYLQLIGATVPAGVGVTGVAIDASTPLTVFTQPTVPLQGSRIATVVLDGTAPDLEHVKQWLDALATLPGFSDAVPGSVATSEGGGFNVTVTMHVGQGAFWNRFLPEEPADSAAASTDGTDTSVDAGEGK